MLGADIPERMRIDNVGNVGIGTDDPSQKLEVAGRIYIEQQGTDWNETTPGTAVGALHLDPVGDGANNTGNAITFGASDSGGGASGNAGVYVRSDGAFGTKMYFATTDSYAVGSKTRMMIDFNGNVGIGTTSPGALLQVGETPTSSSQQGAHIYGYDGALSLYTTRQGESPFNAALYLYNNPAAGTGTGTGILFRAKTGGGGGTEFTQGRIQGAVYTSWTTE